MVISDRWARYVVSTMYVKGDQRSVIGAADLGFRILGVMIGGVVCESC